MFNYSEVKINNFSGGMTDRYIDGTPTTSEKISNLNITKFGTLKIREGYRWYLEANTTEYAPAAAKAYMGLLRLPDSDNVIISHSEKMYVMDDEVEISFSAISDVSVAPSNLITTVVAPIVETVIDDASIQTLLSTGKIPVADASVFTDDNPVYITHTDETTYRSIGTSTVFYVLTKDTASSPETVTLSHEVDGDPLNLSSNGVNVQVADKIRSTAVGKSDGKLYVSNITTFTVGDAINVTNSINTEIRSDGTDNVFYISAKNTNTSGNYLELKALPTDGAALNLSAKGFSAQDNVYTEGGASIRSATYGYITDSTDIITLSTEHGLSNGQKVYFEQIDSKSIGLSENQEYFFHKETDTSGTIHTTVGDGISGENEIALTPITYYGDVLLIKKASASEVTAPNSGSLLKSTTLNNNQHVSFSEWQDQLLTTSEATSLTDLSRPGRIYYGSEPIVFKQTVDTTITAVNHGLSNEDPVEYLCIFGTKPALLTDNKTYYVREVVGDTFKLEENIGSGAIAANFDNEINQLTPLTKSWKSHSLGLPKPCIHTDGSIVDTNMSVTTGSGTGKIYKYAAVYKYIYNSNGVEYTTYGPVRDIDGSGTAYKYETDGALSYSGEITQTNDASPADSDGNITVDDGDSALFEIGDEIKITNNAGTLVRSSGLLDTITGSGESDGDIPVSDSSLFEVDDHIKITNAENTEIRSSGSTLGYFVISKDVGGANTIRVSDTEGGTLLDLTTPPAGIISTDKIYKADNVIHDSFFVIAKPDANTITVSATEGGLALDLTEPDVGIANNDEIYKANSVTALGAARVNPDITLPCLRAPEVSSLYRSVQWNLDRIMIELYRTKENGSTYYYVGESPNLDQPTIEITDTKSDDEIGAEKSLYTTGGGADFHPAPPCKYIINLRDTAYFCNVTEEVESASGGKMFTYQHPSRVYQSIPGISGSMGNVFYVDLDDDIVGVGEVGGLPIIFTDSYIYRLEGRIDLLGSGDIRARVIDENVGCSSHRSIVKTPRGLFWAGKHGFYQTDGYKVANITENLDDSFRGITATNSVRKLINGTYDEKEGRIFWGVCSGANLAEPDMLWVLWTRFMAFTTIEGGDIDASTLLVRDADLYRADKYGSVVKHSSDYAHDTQTVIGDDMGPASVFSWNDVPIHFEYRSNAMSFGMPSRRKWVNETSVSFETSGNMCILPGSANDGQTATSEMKEIKRVSSLTWDDPDFIWGSSDLVWNAPDVITAVRRFPRKEQRCRRKQVRLEPAKFIKYVSDNWYEAYVSQDPDSTTKVKAVTTKWPSDLSEAEICFPGNYVAGKFHYSATGDETKCIPVIDRNSDTEIDFFPGSFTGWEQTSAGQYAEIGEDSSNGYISISDLWKWDFSLDNTGAVGSSAARETGLIGLTKDWTLSYWFKSEYHLDNRANEDHLHLRPYGNNPYIAMSINMNYHYQSFELHRSDNNSTGTGGHTSLGWRYESWTPGATTPRYLASDGVGWNHIVLTHKGTPRQTDDRKFGAVFFTASSKAIVNSITGIASGTIGVDDASVFTVGECINITNTEGTVTRVHNTSPKDSDYARPHTFYIQAKDEDSNTITLATTDNANPCWADYSPFPTAYGPDGKIRITRAEFLDVGDVVSIVLWNRNTDVATEKMAFPNHLTGSAAGPAGEGTFNGATVTDFYVKSKEYDKAVDNSIITLSATEGGPDDDNEPFDFRGTWLSGSDFTAVLESGDTPKIYLSSSIDGTGDPLVLAAANLSTSGIVNTDKIYVEHSVHEPSPYHLTGGIYNTDSTPGWTTYVNGKAVSSTTGDGRTAYDIAEFIEWTRNIDGDTNSTIVQMFGTEGETSRSQGPEGAGINNITYWNSYKSEEQVSNMYNAGIQKDFEDGDCKVQITFNEANDGLLATGELTNSGADPTIVTRFQQGAHSGDEVTVAAGAGQTDGSVAVAQTHYVDIAIGEPVVITNSSNSTARAHQTGKIFYIIYVSSGAPHSIILSDTLGGEALDISSIVQNGDKIYRSIDVNTETGSQITGNPAVWSIKNNKVKWSIKKHQLDQEIELKEIDVKFGIMDNVEGRYEKEIEKSNE